MLVAPREAEIQIGLMERTMNHRMLLTLIVIVLPATGGCLPRHPPHTPQPLDMKATYLDHAEYDRSVLAE